tara:strand:+ start:8638 stop:10197 length:1560 start_codon:yes stop_codon:yes gene_type:complete
MNTSAQATYTSLESDRYSYLTRARDASRLTLPTLMPDEGANSTTTYDTPYQSVGARGVNNLAASLLLSLLPPNAPFFRLRINPKEESKIDKSSDQGEAWKTDFEVAMGKIERFIMSEIETQAFRIQTFEALKHLIITGNVLLNFSDEGGMRVIHLDRYVIKRCGQGKVRLIVIKETVSADMLPEPAKAILANQPNVDVTKDIDLYTCVKSYQKTKGKQKVEMVAIYQEIFGTVIPDTVGDIKAEDSPYLVLRMLRAEGENYGRGYVEQYIGDLKSLESLMMSVVEAAAAASKCLFLVAPNGVTRARTIAEAPNGAIVEGNASDVSVLGLNKNNDFAIASATIQTISDRLAYAFLLTDNAIRQAERVTAAEVRLVTQSIERQLGGIYSVLSQEFQLPLVRHLMLQMSKEKKIPKLGSRFVVPQIVTGVEALGRGNDLNKMDEFLAGVGQLLGPEVLGQYINYREYLDRRALSLGIDTHNLIKSEEQIQKEQQDAMMQQMGPELMAQAAAEGQPEMEPEPF